MTFAEASMLFFTILFWIGLIGLISSLSWEIWKRKKGKEKPE